jgi:hypothetical protein
MRSFISAVAIFPGLLLAADVEQRIEHRFGSISVGSLLDIEAGQGCGCSFFFPPAAKRKGTQILSWAEGEQASIFVNGQLVKLNETTPTPYPTQVGEKHTIKLTSQTVTVSGQLKTTLACPAKSESCEANELRGSIHIQSGASSSTAIPVWGSCGC